MTTLTTVGGWAFIIAAAGGVYFVTKQRTPKTLRSVNPKQSSKAAEPRKETKGKKGKKDSASSGGDQGGKQVQKKKQPAKAAVEELVSGLTDSKSVERDEKDADREFARQLSNAKRGVVDTPKSQSSTRTKSVKQTRAQEKPVAEIPSETGTAPSSTTGADADDDQSPFNSPDLAATTAPAVNGDVSDMLEKPSDGPSVLKITAPTNSFQSKKAKQPPQAEVKETKKQRQNRKKVEEKKVAREEDEKARKVQMESQRRTAREAEGRAAKDGSTFMASQAPPSSAWNASAAIQATNDTNTAPSNKVELLDTYEPVNGHVSSKPVDEVYSESEVAGSKLAAELSRIPEEEQIRVATEDSGLWEQVKTSRKKKTGKEAANDTRESKSIKENKPIRKDNPSSNDESSDYGVPPVIAPTGPGKKWQMDVSYVENGKVVERETEVQDSEWEVA